MRQWIGKLAGAALGFLAGGPVGAAVGAIAGHQFDRGFARATRHRHGGWNGAGPEATRQAFFRATFSVMGHVAKSDGRVSEAEIRAARAVMHRMRLAPEQVREAIALFTDGKHRDFAWRDTLDALRRECRGQDDLLRAFVEIQMHAALADGHLSGARRTSLWEIARYLGVGRSEFAQLEALMRSRRSTRATRNGTDDLRAAYKALGVDAGVPDDEVKHAYRRLMNQHHPDKLVARGLPESMLGVAKEKTREIRSAYETVRDARRMR